MRGVDWVVVIADRHSLSRNRDAGTPFAGLKSVEAGGAKTYEIEVNEFHAPRIPRFLKLVRNTSKELTADSRLGG